MKSNRMAVRSGTWFSSQIVLVGKEQDVLGQSLKFVLHSFKRRQQCRSLNVGTAVPKSSAKNLSSLNLLISYFPFWWQQKKITQRHQHIGDLS